MTEENSKEIELEKLREEVEKEFSNGNISTSNKDFILEYLAEDLIDAAKDLLKTAKEEKLKEKEQEERDKKAKEMEEEEADKKQTTDKLAAGASLLGPEGAIAGAALEAKASNDKNKTDKKAQKAREPSTGSKIKNTYDKANNAFMGFQRDAKDLFGKARSTLEPIIFFLILLAMHLFEVYTGFSRLGSYAAVKALAYILIWLYASFLYYKTDFSQGSLELFGISLVAFLLPYLKIIPFLNLMEGVIGVILIFLPIWIIFFLFHEDKESKFRKLGKFYLIMWIIIAVVILLSSYTFPKFMTSSDGFLLGEPVKIFMGTITNSFDTMIIKIKQTINPSSIKSKAEETFNPYTKYYTGTVEKNKKEPIGVFIEDVRSLTQKTYIDEEPMIISEFVGKSFLDKDIAIWPSCRIESQQESETGVADPIGPIDLNYRLQRSVVCKYPSKRKAGYYDAIIGANFDFETWAYITYTFVDLNTIQTYYQQNKDINKELDIDSSPRAIYTSGPVSIGVSSSRMPIDINTQSEDPRDAIKQRLGFTLGNFWQQGDIKQVNSINVLVPSPFELDNCNPIPFESENYNSELDVKNYTFSTAGFQHLSDNKKFDPRNDLRTVTCELVLPNKDAVDKVVGFGAKTPVTFVVIANYNYQLEKTLRLRIEQ